MLLVTVGAEASYPENPVDWAPFEAPALLLLPPPPPPQATSAHAAVQATAICRARCILFII